MHVSQLIWACTRMKIENESIVDMRSHRYKSIFIQRKVSIYSSDLFPFLRKGHRMHWPQTYTGKREQPILHYFPRKRYTERQIAKSENSTELSTCKGDIWTALFIIKSGLFLCTQSHKYGMYTLLLVHQISYCNGGSGTVLGEREKFPRFWKPATEGPEKS